MQEKNNIKKSQHSYNKKEKRPLGKNKIIIYIILIVFMCLIIFSGYNIISYIIDTNKNKQIIDETNNSLKIDSAKKDDDLEKYTVDFNNLKESNLDTVAYLVINSLDIKYAVVQSNDNEFYLNHNFNKEYNSGGWIFADYRNNFDGKDKNIILYGHNMMNGTMFANLRDTLKEEFINNDENNKIILITETGAHLYKIFSVYDIEVEEYYINTYFNDNEEFGRYINNMKYRSSYDYGVEVNENDSILTLSTCSSPNMRFVVQAKKIK